MSGSKSPRRKGSSAKSKFTADQKDEEQNNTNTNTDSTEKDDLIRLDLYNSDDLIELDNTFNEFQQALNLQKAKLTAKWISNYTKHDPINKDNNNNTNTNNNKKNELLIDTKSFFKHISHIGMLRGHKFAELEKEQNKAIKKLEEVLNLEENARISRNKAIEIQNETELEMKAIDEQRAIIAHELAKADPELKKARDAVSSISDAALNELVSLKKPPSTVENVLRVAVWIIHSKVEKTNKPPKTPKTPSLKASNSARGPNKKFFNDSNSLNNPNTSITSSNNPKSPTNRPNMARSNSSRREKNRSKSKNKDKKVDILKQSWQDTRKLVASSNFKKQILLFDPKTLAKKVCSKIEMDFLSLEDFTYERANKASKVLGPLVQWIISLVAYGKIWYKIQPMADKVSELEIALELRTLEVEQLKHTSEGLHNKVIEIRGEMLVMIGYKKIGDLYFLS